MKHILSRKEKEEKYTVEMRRLQVHWGNPIQGAFDDDWRKTVSAMSEQDLNKAIKDTIGQLRFERWWGAIGKLIIAVVLCFVGLGLLGLLIFGIKQLI